jgi:hypothetical protein
MHSHPHLCPRCSSTVGIAVFLSSQLLLLLLRVFSRRGMSVGVHVADSDACLDRAKLKHQTLRPIK